MAVWPITVVLSDDDKAIITARVQQEALLWTGCVGKLKASRGRSSSVAWDETVWTSSLPLAKVRGSL